MIFPKYSIQRDISTQEANATGLYGRCRAPLEQRSDRLYWTLPPNSSPSAQRHFQRIKEVSFTRRQWWCTRLERISTEEQRAIASFGIAILLS